MNLIITLISITTAIFLIWTWIKSKFRYWGRRGIKTVPPTLLFGNMETVSLRKESFGEYNMGLYKYFKSQGLNHAGFYVMWTPVYLPIDIGIIKSIMQVDFEHFTDRGLYSNENDPLSLNLINLGGKKWKLLRNKLSPTFTSGKIKMMHETILNCTTGLYEVMNKESVKPVDIKDILGRFTTDVIGSCAFGLSCNTLKDPNSEFREKVKTVFHLGFVEYMKHSLCFILPGFMRFFNTKLLSKDINDFFMNIVRDTVAYRKEENIQRNDFMHLLIQLKNKGQLVEDDKMSAQKLTKEDNKITLDEIAAQAFIFFEAGFETSSTTMTFCLYELAKNKGVQDRVRKEIKDVLSKHDNEMTYEAATDMQYLEQVINETFRLHPPLPVLNRKCTKTYKVPGEDLVLEKGMRIMIPVMGIHHDSEYFPDPEKFDPDRFSEENKRNIKPFTFLPFGEGPRVCIGARFGMLQTKVGLAALLMNYEFTLSDKTVDPLKYHPESFILSTEGEMWLNVKRISSDNISLLKQKD